MFLYHAKLTALRCAAVLPLALACSPALANAEQSETTAVEAVAVAAAGQDLPTPPPATEASATRSQWEITATPYIWFSGLNGDVGVFPRLPPVNVDIGFDDVLENLKFAGMVAIMVRKDRFVVLADISYIDVGTSTDVGIRDPEFANVSIDTQTFTTTLAAGYRAVDRGPLFLDVLAGARLSSVDTEIELAGPTRTLVADSNETWLDPVVGARFHAPLGGNWALALYGDIGGFGVSSDLTWQLLGTLQLTLSDRWRLAAGWRHYAIDYEKDSFLYDVSMGGPIVGVSYSF